MPRGRKPAAKRLQDQGHQISANNTCSIRYGDESTQPPPSIAEDPAAMDCWEMTCKTLIAAGTFQASDRLAIQRYATAHSATCHAEQQVLEGKLIQETSTGYTAISAALIAWSKAAKICEGAEKQLGLSVDSRRALSLDAAPPVDELDEFLANN